MNVTRDVLDIVRDGKGVARCVRDIACSGLLSIGVETQHVESAMFCLFFCKTILPFRLI